METPVCEKRYKELVVHDHLRKDPYYWLNERENPEVIEYLNAENKYCDAQMKDTVDLQKDLYEEITSRLDPDESSTPYYMDGYYYYSQYKEGKEYPYFARKKGNLDAEEQVLLDQNVLAEGQEFCALGTIAISPNDRILAFSMDTVSRRLYDVYFLDLESKEMWSSEIKGISGSLCWSNDGRQLFYTKKDPQTLRSNQVFRHQFQTNEKDELIFQEDDEAFICSIYKSKSKQFLFIGSYSTDSTELRYLEADKGLEEPKLFLAREDKHEYSIDHHFDSFLIVSNREAENFKLCSCTLQDTNEANWKIIKKHRRDVLLQGIEVFQDFWVLEERKGGLSQFRVIRYDTREEFVIPMEADTYMAYTSTNRDYKAPYFRYGYTSLVTPSSIYDYNVFTGIKKLRKQQKVIGGYNEEDYHTERLYAPASDGTQVPISLVYNKNTFKENESPLLLYGYGSYGHVVDPSFSPARLSLLDRGFAFAIAHIRGGEDLGRYWYEQGRMLQKRNTFTDFITCGEFLVEQGYAAKDNLHAMGGSAGGLLMGAVMNMQPQLWKSLIAAVPFVDVVTTMLDDTIPLTTGEYNEWGNPNYKEYYEYMLSYSPYDQVEKKDYPALLVTTGLHDSQVQYWEPAKWVAKLRDYKTNDSLLLLKTNMDTGHGGASGRYEYYKEVALDYAFLLKMSGFNYQ